MAAGHFTSNSCLEELLINITGRDRDSFKGPMSNLAKEYYEWASPDVRDTLVELVNRNLVNINAGTTFYDKLRGCYLSCIYNNISVEKVEAYAEGRIFEVAGIVVARLQSTRSSVVACNQHKGGNGSAPLNVLSAGGAAFQLGGAVREITAQQHEQWKQNKDAKKLKNKSNWHTVDGKPQLRVLSA